MLFVGRWRWPLIIAFPFAAALILLQCGLVTPFFESRVVLRVTRETKRAEALDQVQLQDIRRQMTVSAGAPVLRVERSLERATDIVLAAQSSWPSTASEAAQAATQAIINHSLTKQKADLRQAMADLEQRKSALAAQWQQLLQDREAAFKKV